jgi:hypothetical protein
LFNKPIVFVIGAGASYEYGLPLGGTLKDTIAEKVRFRFQRESSYLTGGDQDLLDHIRRHVSDEEKRNEYTRAGSTLAAAIPSFISIDEALHYLGATPQAVEVGKIAIIQEILRAEGESQLRIDRQRGKPDVDSVDACWMAGLLSMALAEIQRGQLQIAFDKVTFINFNYDRAIEHYLYWALQQRASATPDEARQIVENLHMIRPYGSIGPLSFNVTDPYSFGSTAYFDPFKRIKNIRTYTEQKPMHDADALGRALVEAQLIVFLGFGYHAANLDLLRTIPATSAASVLGTVVGIHRENIELISSRITHNMRINRGVSLLDMNASALLRDLRQRILISLE